MKKMMFTLSASAMLLGTAATADPFVDAVVSNLRSLGYEYIEIDRGLTQAKAEAVRGTQKIEVIYDIATGQILKQEYETAGPGYLGRTGVEIDFERRDYLDDDDDDNGRSSSGRDDDDDDNGRSGSGSDDDDDDNGRSGSGRDDDDDDHGGRSGSSGGGSGSGSGSGSGGGSNDDNDDD
jgi:hypothetical protein